MPKLLIRRKTKYSYSPTGVRRIAAAITATLRYDQLTERRMTDWVNRHEIEISKKAHEKGIERIPIQISHGTLNRYANAVIKEPQDDVLKAIAPLIYKVVAFSPKGVAINTREKYLNWEDLATLGTKRVIEEMETLMGLIRIEMRVRGVKLEDFAQSTGLPEYLLKQMLDQGELFESEYALDSILSHLAPDLTNPITHERFRNEYGLAKFCGLADTNTGILHLDGSVVDKESFIFLDF